MAIDTVHHLGSEFGYSFYERALEQSAQARAVAEEMRGLNLDPQPERTQVFSVFSPDSMRSIAVSITPFTSKDFTLEGGLSVSAGGHAQGVVVDIADRTRISGFTHIALVNGERLVTSHHDVDELYQGRPDGGVDQFLRSIAEGVGKIPAGQPLIEIEARQVRSLASISFNTLLGDDLSRSVHTNEEITRLQGNTTLVGEIGLFVLFRTSGSACCSCSCSCWGSSSCSCSAG